MLLRAYQGGIITEELCVPAGITLLQIQRVVESMLRGARCYRICCFVVIRLQVRSQTARLVMNLEQRGIVY